MRKNTGIRIAASGRALPAKSCSNNEFKAYMDTDDEWIYRRTGISTRGFCDPCTEDNISMALKASENAIAAAKSRIPGFVAEDIGAVLVTSCSGSYRLPSCACMLQTGLGLPKRILALDLNAACSGFIYALMTARALLLAEGYRYCLITASEQLSAETDLHDRSTGILFGDGAASVIVELAEGEGICAFSAAAWSDGNDEILRCGIEPGGTLAREAGISGETVDEGGRLRACKNVIEMKGHDVFRFASEAVPQTIDELLKQSGIELDELDYILCHQANARIIDHVKKKYKGHEHKFLMNIEQHGNTSSASIPILLDEMIEEGVIKSGMRIMCVGFGAGLTWGGAIVNVG